MKITAPGEKLSGSHWGLQWTDGAAECPEGDLLDKLLGRGYIPAPAVAEQPEATEAAPKKKRTKKPKEA